MRYGRPWDRKSGPYVDQIFPFLKCKVKESAKNRGFI